MNGLAIRWSDGAWKIMPDITLVKYHTQREVSYNFLAYALNLKIRSFERRVVNTTSEA